MLRLSAETLTLLASMGDVNALDILKMGYIAANVRISNLGPAYDGTVIATLCIAGPMRPWVADRCVVDAIKQAMRDM